MEALLVLLILAGGCRKGTDSTIVPPPVTVSHPISQPVTEYLDLTGTTAPSKTVDLMARVSGYLESVNFQDGAFVEKGQLLFVIEPPPYEQQVALNEAVLVQAQAEYDRQLEMMKQNATSTSNVEKWRSSRDQAQAQVELAKINLGYTRVTAPFAGRIGQRLVDPGNLVGAGTRPSSRRSINCCRFTSTSTSTSATRSKCGRRCASSAWKRRQPLGKPPSRSG